LRNWRPPQHHPARFGAISVKPDPLDCFCLVGYDNPHQPNEGRGEFRDIIDLERASRVKAQRVAKIFRADRELALLDQVSLRESAAQIDAFLPYAGRSGDISGPRKVSGLA
jgi:hypothetical protein